MSLRLYCTISFLIAHAAHAAGGVEFFKGNVADAHKEASESNKIVMTEFYTQWCLTCKTLHATTFKNPQVVDWLKQNAVAVQLDADEEKEFAEKLSVESYPTLVFTLPDGREFYRIRGAPSAEVFLNSVSEAVRRVRSEITGGRPQRMEMTLADIGQRVKAAYDQYNEAVSVAENSPNGVTIVADARKKLVMDIMPYYEATMRNEMYEQAESIVAPMLTLDMPADVYHALAIAGLRSGAPNEKTMHYAGKALQLSGAKNAGIVTTAARVLAKRGHEPEARRMLEKSLAHSSEADRLKIEQCMSELGLNQ